MSYRRRAHSTYDVRRMHIQFRSAWEEGLRRAAQIAGELRNKGWSVDDSLYYMG